MLITKKNWEVIYFINSNGEKTSRVCKDCQRLKPITSYYNDVEPRCKPCKNLKRRNHYKTKSRERELALNSKWREEKREKATSLVRKWRKENPYKEMAIRQKHRATKHGLPCNMKAKDYEELLIDIQEGKCVLTGTTSDLTIEHFICLNTGKGGSIKGNLYYVNAFLNHSKNAKNPFQWIKTQPNYIQRNFYNKLVPLLAEQNNMTTVEFENYVNNCYEEMRGE